MGSWVTYFTVECQANNLWKVLFKKFDSFCRSDCFYGVEIYNQKGGIHLMKF